EYILRRPENLLTIACRRISHAETLSRSFPRATPIALDVTNETALDAALIITVTRFLNDTECDFELPTYRAKENGITILNEIGLDPGIDHLYAVKTVNEVHEAGGKIVSFISYCGGLPAPEASNNPLGYKFSWSSRGVLLALRNSAKFFLNGEIVEIPGTQLMLSAKPYFIYPAFAFWAYPNRDSTPFREFYNIPEAKTVLR
ncbi:3047_t:CDS:2, partial [Racocetra fulgida]